MKKLLRLDFLHTIMYSLFQWWWSQINHPSVAVWIRLYICILSIILHPSIHLYHICSLFFSVQNFISLFLSFENRIRKSAHACQPTTQLNNHSFNKQPLLFTASLNESRNVNKTRKLYLFLEIDTSHCEYFCPKVSMHFVKQNINCTKKLLCFWKKCCEASDQVIFTL